MQRSQFGVCGMQTALLCTIAAVGTESTPAQGHIVGFGHTHFDTAAWSTPAQTIAARGDEFAVARSDQRIYVQRQHTVAAPSLPPGTTVVQLGLCSSWVNERNGFALLSSGNIVTWGTAGGLPAPPLPPNVRYVRMVTGYAHVLALRSDGVAVAWGDNYSGQTTLPAVPTGLAVIDIAAGSSTSFLLLSNGSLLSCGSNGSGQQNIPVLPPGVTWTACWAGRGSVFARRSDGVLEAWGDNTSGQLLLPPTPPGVTYVEFAAGSGHAVARRSDGAVAVWGDNTYGQLDLPTLPSSPAVEVVAGDNFSAVRLADGRVFGWGRSLFLPQAQPAGGERWQQPAGGMLPVGLTDSGRAIPLGSGYVLPAPPTGMRYEAAFGGPQGVVLLRDDGRAVAVGSNTFGQLAIPPLPPGIRYVKAALGWEFTALLRSDGQVVLATYMPLSVPALPAGGRYEQIAANGDRRLLLLRSDGSVIDLAGARLGGNLPPGVRYIGIAAAYTLAAGLRSDGEVDLWGASIQVPFPPLPAGVVYLAVAAAGDVIYARRSDGQVVAAARQANDPLLAVPAPEPGESFVSLDAAGNSGSGLALCRAAAASTFVAFAQGCSGTLPASRLIPLDTPRLGRPLDVRLFDLPENAAVVVCGWQRLPPQSLAGVGMPGCFQHISADATLLVIGSQQQAVWRLPVPLVPQLVGVQLHSQAVVFDPAANPAGAVTSAAATARLGDW